MSRVFGAGDGERICYSMLSPSPIYEIQRLLLYGRKSEDWRHWKRKCPKVCLRCVLAVTEKKIPDRCAAGRFTVPLSYSESIAPIELSWYVNTCGLISCMGLVHQTRNLLKSGMNL